MASWDVFHADRLELERALDAATIRDRLARGDLRDDDLVRPAGTTVAWARLSDIPELAAPPEPAPAPAAALAPPPASQPAPAPAPAPSARPIATSRSTQGDFEFQEEEAAADRFLPGAPTVRSPDWLELRTDTDDVAFPVFDDGPKLAGSQVSPPSAKPAEPVEADLPGGWLWAEDDDDDEDVEEDEHIASAVEPPVATRAAAPPASGSGSAGLEILDDDLDLDLDLPVAHARHKDTSSQGSQLALPVVTARGWDDVGPVGEDAAEEEDFTFSRSGPATVEELDLAPMVDVAFQLVLFFMVTATTILYRTLEIPKPSNEEAPAGVTQGRSLEDLQDDYILVEIDPAGAIKIDRESVPPNMEALMERMRTAREKTGRKSMLLSADYTTKHRNCVLAYDAALEIGLGIAIASPQAPQGPAPTLLPGAKASAGPLPPARGPAQPAPRPPPSASTPPI